MKELDVMEKTSVTSSLSRLVKILTAPPAYPELFSNVVPCIDSLAHFLQIIADTPLEKVASDTVITEISAEIPPSEKFEAEESSKIRLLS